MSQVICGLTFEQYIEFHSKFVLLMQNEATVEQLVEFLAEYSQKPVWEEGETGESLCSDYYMGGGLKPWEDVIAKNSELAGRKAMALLNIANAQEHGGLEGDSGIEIAGVSLEAYAELCATYHLHTGNEAAAETALAPIFAKHGVRDKSHFDEINREFSAAIQADETGHLSSHYGRLFMEFQPQHAANCAATIGEAVTANQARLEHDEKKKESLHIKLREMSKSSGPEEIAQLVRDTYPEEADDEEFLDDHLSEVADDLYEEEELEQVKVLLAARFEILQPGGDREEWVAERLDELFGAVRVKADKIEIGMTDSGMTVSAYDKKKPLSSMRPSSMWISIVVVIVIALAIVLFR